MLLNQEGPNLEPRHIKLKVVGGLTVQALTERWLGHLAVWKVDMGLLMTLR